MSFAPIRFLALPALFGALLALAGCSGGGTTGATPNPTPSNAPSISALSPLHGSPGTAVSLTGTNFLGTTSVAFNGRTAFGFTVASASQINAVVPSGATTGAIQIATPNGSAASASFTVDAAQTPTLDAFSPASFAAGTVVTLTGTHFVGATQVRFNGVDAASFTVVSDTQIQATAPANLTAGVLSVITPGGTAAAATAYTVPTTPSGIQVLMNTGFEQTSPIVWQGNTGIIQGASGSSVVPHGGTLFAWLGGYGEAQSDQLSQALYIPATATAATATFYLKILTSETGSTAKDTFTLSALNSGGTTLATLLTKSNLDASGYAAYTVNLLPYKGQTVVLSFKSQEDGSNATSFLVDDVTATLTVPTSSDLKPVISSFTPTSGIAGEATVQITGGNFFGVTAVTIGGASATYTLTDGTALSAVLPASAATGSAPIAITNAQGTGTSAATFQVSLGTPVITGMNPAQGSVGTTVVITGSYLGYSGTTVTLNGQAVALTSQSATRITFVVPAGATSGNVVVTTPGGSANRGFTVTPSGATLDLHIEKLQFTQSTQTLDNAVPIVAGKAGLVRVFVLANQSNTAAPAVQVTLLNGGVAVAGYPKTIAAPVVGAPLTVDESSLSASWNLSIPATDLTTPSGSGYSLQAVVDPSNAISEADKTNNSATAAFTSRTVPIFRTTIFPVSLSSGTGNITTATKDSWAARLAKMYPVASVDVVLGSTFTGSVSTLSSDGTNWDTLLNDLTAKHLADGASDRYYFGALAVDYASGVAGLGWVPPTSSTGFKYRTAIGWDKTGYADGGNYPEVFAHETGHNMGRSHSPCGGASDPDPNYPYSGALIGMWGYDTVLNALQSPATTKDIMAYCKPNWVSDYTYKKILEFRAGTGGFLVVGAEDDPLPKSQAESKECLLVRGIVHEDGKVELLPSFRTQALPSNASTQGEYVLEGQDAQGNSLFTASLDLMELGCGPKEHVRHFVMALPLEATALDALSTLAVQKAGRTVATARSTSASARVVAAAPEAHRVAEGRIQLTWDAAVHPAALVRDADTGEVIAILSGGRQVLPSAAKRLDVVLSDGVRGRTQRLETLK
ncbi:IPT/TIG domain-containing protein [Geothrix sp. 21YS21S-4]|uniref:IPT/TIG domain-containing protein n=1 Tax=Geothrix sp. 21YS21S-4 TaxID=3068889 RepID=UPI0027B8E01A|nr:IPT/TIG domain-containing protein [Geothrix sp. 21YS21S-4]